MAVSITESAADMENMRCFITAWQMSNDIEEVREPCSQLSRFMQTQLPGPL